MTLTFYVEDPGEVRREVLVPALQGLLAGADALDPSTVRAFAVTFNEGAAARRRYLAALPGGRVTGGRAAVSFDVVISLAALGYNSASIYEVSIFEYL